MKRQESISQIKLISLITCKHKINTIFKFRMSSLILMSIRISRIKFRVMCLSKCTMILKRKKLMTSITVRTKKECFKSNFRNRLLLEVELLVSCRKI